MLQCHEWDLTLRRLLFLQDSRKKGSPFYLVKPRRGGKKTTTFFGAQNHWCNLLNFKFWEEWKDIFVGRCLSLGKGSPCTMETEAPAPCWAHPEEWRG